MRNEKIGKDKSQCTFESNVARATYDFMCLTHKRYLKFYFITWYKDEYVNISS